MRQRVDAPGWKIVGYQKVPNKKIGRVEFESFDHFAEQHVCYCTLAALLLRFA